MIVFAASVIALLFVVANITLNAREFNNSLEARKQAYIDNAAHAFDSWYRKNAGRLDVMSGAPSYTEDELFQQAGIAREFDAHVVMTALKGSAGSNLFYRNIIVWIPAFGVVDTSGLDASGNFVPNFQETRYRVISGQKIEGENIGQTTTTMREIARLLEARSRAKTEGDPVHDVRTNYFRAISCSAPLSEEIPCTTTVNPSTGWASVAEPVLKLQELAGVNVNTAFDAWGHQIEFNNYDQSNYAASRPDCADNSSVVMYDTEQGDPPFIATLRTQTPWGTVLCLRAVQPIN